MSQSFTISPYTFVPYIFNYAVGDGEEGKVLQITNYRAIFWINLKPPKNINAQRLILY